MDSGQSKDLLQAVFDSAPNGIAVMQSAYDKTGAMEDFFILLLNDYMFRWTGNIDYKGKRYSDVFPMVKKTGILQKFTEVAETGISTNFDARYEGEGMNHWFRFTAVKHGELLVVTTEDITGSRQAETALSDTLAAADKQQRLYESINDNTPDLVYVFDPSYRFVYANKALLNMWGKTAEEAIGKGLRENGYEEWHAQMHEREIDDVVKNKVTIRGTVSFPHAELGSRVYDYIFGPLLNKDGEVETIAGITRDITELKRAEESILQSEARLKSVIDQTPAATLVLRGDGLVIEQINSPMLQLIGRGEEIIGQRLIDVLPELEGQYVWKQVRQVYEEGVPFYQSEVCVPHNRTGVMRNYYYNLAYRPLIEEGKITGMVQVAIDVTEQVEARKKTEESERRYKTLSETLEQQVNERTKELQRSNHDLQQFAHVASHDLKEPVRKIKIFTSRLEDQAANHLDEESKGFISKIHAATNRMLTMIDGVLGYSTTNADEQKAESVDLNDIIKNIESDLELALEKTGASVFCGRLPVIEGAPVLLYQLFYNLINNAIKFAKEGVPLKVSISSETLSDKESYCRITLKDNGIGFDPKYAEQIFETFTRLNSKDRYEGTGLGLSLCKKIAERHGGSISASGIAGEGAVFTITLPLHQKESNI